MHLLSFPHNWRHLHVSDEKQFKAWVS